MKPSTAKKLSQIVSVVSFVFVAVLTKLVVGSMEIPHELRKK